MKIGQALTACVATFALFGSPAPSMAAAKQNWTAKVTVAEDGSHLLGNPDAKVKVSEFVSYTCSHCATFQEESESPLRLAYVMPGKVSVRVVHLIRDPIDLTVAMLTNCGDPKGFFARHHAFLSSQDKWLPKAQAASEAQRARWSAGDIPTRLRAIANDFDFYAMMEQRGMSRVAVDRCFADTAMAKKIAEQRAEAERLAIPGTPSFAIGGELLDAVHDWESLRVAIDAAL